MGIEEKVGVDKVRPIIKELLDITNTNKNPNILYKAIANDYGNDGGTIRNSLRQKLISKRFYNYVARLNERIKEKKGMINRQNGTLRFNWDPAEESYNNVLRVYRIDNERLDYYISRRFKIKRETVKERITIAGNKEKKIVEFLRLLENKETNTYSQKKIYNIRDLAYVISFGLGEVVELPEKFKMVVDFGFQKMTMSCGYWQSDEGLRSGFRNPTY